MAKFKKANTQVEQAPLSQDQEVLKKFWELYSMMWRDPRFFSQIISGGEYKEPIVFKLGDLLAYCPQELKEELLKFKL